MNEEKIFDLISDDYDKYRTTYCEDAFEDVIKFSKLTKGSRVLEIGPGTGQATKPLLDTGCEYYGIDIGENLLAIMKKKILII